MFGKRLFRSLKKTLHAFIFSDSYQKAAALAFYTLLSSVPLLAVILAIATGFGHRETIETYVFDSFSHQQEIVFYALAIAQNMLEDAKGGLIAGVGILVLLWSILRLLSTIEKILCQIWGNNKVRSWGRKLSDYLAILIVCPILLIILSSLNIFLRAQIDNPSKIEELFGFLTPSLLFALKTIPYIISWLLFSFFYYLMTNSIKFNLVHFGAGIIAGTLFQLWQAAYIFLQVKIFRYGAIYGAFAALPLFMIWLQMSWLIVIFGAEWAAAWKKMDSKGIPNVTQ